MIARAASRSRLRSESGASVAMTITHDPSPRSPGDCASRWNAYCPSSFPTGAPSTWSTPPKFVWTSTPTVQPPSDCGSTRDDVPIPPFQPNATVPVPAPTLPSATGPSDADVERRAHLLRRDRPRANVVERAVIRFRHDRIDRPHVRHSRLLEHPVDHRVGRLPDTERAREQDRRLELAELVQLGRSGDLAEAVSDVQRRGHAVGEQVPAVRQNRGHAGANVVALDHRRLPDAHAGDVGDRVEPAGREHARLDAEIARPRALGGRLRGECGHREDRREREWRGSASWGMMTPHRIAASLRRQPRRRATDVEPLPPESYLASCALLAICSRCTATRPFAPDSPEPCLGAISRPPF